MDMFMVRNMYIALKLDARAETRAMSFYVERPDKLAMLFDDIAYEKCNIAIFSTA